MCCEGLDIMLLNSDRAMAQRGFPQRPDLRKPLTGRSVVVMLGLFFGVMFAANGALIYTALSTLHGEELANSYDASQVYNQRIAEARAQNLLGWVADVTTRQEGGGERVVADFKRSRRRADRGPGGARALRASVRQGRRSRSDPDFRRGRLRRRRRAPTCGPVDPRHRGETRRTAEVHEPEQDHARGDRCRGLARGRDAGFVGFRSPSRRRGVGDGPRRRGRPLRRLHQHDRKGPQSRSRRARRARQSGEQARHRRMG